MRGKRAHERRVLRRDAVVCVNNVVRALRLRLESGAVRSPRSPAARAAKQRAAGGTARDAVRGSPAFLEEKVASGALHWDVLLRWASSMIPRRPAGAVGLGDPAVGGGALGGQAHVSTSATGVAGAALRCPKSFVNTEGRGHKPTPRVEECPWSMPRSAARRCGVRQ